MKRKITVGLFSLALVINMVGCQAAAKQLGGTVTVDLDVNKKLMECTWKDNDLWFLTKDMTEDDIAETYEFKESSNLGVLEGTVIIKEHKTK